MKKAYIIHGWGGYPDEGWLPWLHIELEKVGYTVERPSMPDTDNPRIETWVPFLASTVNTPNEETLLVGHSIGCQTILRYLETFSSGRKVAQVILVAPWLGLTPETLDENESEEIARPWIDTPIDFEKVKTHCDNFTCIFSDNDSFVPLTDADIFKEKLGTKIIVEHEKGHFSGSDGVKELSIVLDQIKK